MSVHEFEPEKALEYASSLVKTLTANEGTHRLRAGWARKASEWLESYARVEMAKAHREERGE